MPISSWFSKMLGSELTLNNLENLLVMQLRDLKSAEEQLIEALPKLAEAAANPELQSAFQTHLDETRRQKDRLDQVFRLLGKDATSESCEAMQGLISEGEEIIALDGDPDVKDAALIAAAQRVEHYEIAGYGCARTFARRIGRNDVAELLQQSLDEEANADKILTHVAESEVNVEAASEGGAAEIPSQLTLLASESDRLMSASPPNRAAEDVLELAKARLQASAYKSIQKISCKYSNGMLVSRGSVPSFFHKQLAQHDVRDLVESGRIDNQIDVCQAN